MQQFSLKMNLLSWKIGNIRMLIRRFDLARQSRTKDMMKLRPLLKAWYFRYLSGVVTSKNMPLPSLKSRHELFVAFIKIVSLSVMNAQARSWPCRLIYSNLKLMFLNDASLSQVKMAPFDFRERLARQGGVHYHATGHRGAVDSRILFGWLAMNFDKFLSDTASLFNPWTIDEFTNSELIYSLWICCSFFKGAKKNWFLWLFIAQTCSNTH